MNDEWTRHQLNENIRTMLENNPKFVSIIKCLLNKSIAYHSYLNDVNKTVNRNSFSGNIAQINYSSPAEPFTANHEKSP
jgi:phospholipid N-methyltransferase